MIEEVERVGAKLEVDAFGERDFSSEREVNLCKSKTGNIISSFSSLLTGCRCGECRRIQSLPPRARLSCLENVIAPLRNWTKDVCAIRSVHIKRLVGDQIGA